MSPVENTDLQRPVQQLPDKQTVLLLHAPRQPYTLTEDYPVPGLRDDSEALVRVQAIGLNPLDWRSWYATDPSVLQRH
jgi:NADPH:quinone reductase-like Zn-dependent oxidoreductase